MGFKTKRIARKSPVKSKTFNYRYVATSDGSVDVTAAFLGCWAYAATGKIVDIVIRQEVTGANGTDITVNVLKNGTTVLATNGKVTLAAGASKTVDLKAEVTAISGCVRPVLSATATVPQLAKGDVLTLTTTHTGTYSSTFPTINVSVVVEGLYF